MVTTKRCAYCFQEKPANATYFYPNHKCKDKLRIECQNCTSSGPPTWTRGMKFCRLCVSWKPATKDFFYPSRQRPDGLRTECIPCKIKDSLTWHQTHPEQAHAAWSRYSAKKMQEDAVTTRLNWNNKTKKSQESLRQEVITAYGGRCSRCGETIRKFLSIEHLLGNGGAHRRALGGNSLAVYRALKRQGFPTTNYTIYCINCQWESRDYRDTSFSQYKDRVKAEMISAYGGKCSCCHYTDFRALTLEHSLRDGKQHRASVPGRNSFGTWRDLKRRGWPKEGFTLLCANCNHATRYGNICPHKQ